MIASYGKHIDNVTLVPHLIVNNLGNLKFQFLVVAFSRIQINMNTYHNLLYPHGL